MIRSASSSDAPFIARLIVLAMGGTLAGKFANSTDPAVYTALFEKFAALPGNPYSFENTLVYEDQGLVCGMIIGYDGAGMHQLRETFLIYTRAQLGFQGTPEDETQPGEYYIDCLAVFPQYQRRGIAKLLITALIKSAGSLGHHTIGLLVNKTNNQAKKLYLDSGFKIIGEKALLGGAHIHMQYGID